MGKAQREPHQTRILNVEKNPLKPHSSNAFEICVDKYLLLMNTFIKD